MKIPLPLPLCDRHFEEIAQVVTSCPECRSRLTGILELPIISKYIPEDLRAMLETLIQPKPEEGSARAERAQEDRRG